MCTRLGLGYYSISIHALLAESDPFLRFGRMTHRYFYPRSPCGERRVIPEVYHDNMLFLSTLSLRRATPRCRRHLRGPKFLSTLSLRRATLQALHRCVIRPFLSTLSLRRATAKLYYFACPFLYFYPRSPCGERLYTIPETLVPRQFLSTLSLRRATVTVLGIQHRTGISIHALLAESDPQGVHLLS